MEMHDVQSSVVAAVGYDRDRNVLEVRFRSGRIYHYFDVPQELFEELLGAPSVGQFFNEVVRPRFRSERSL